MLLLLKISNLKNNEIGKSRVKGKTKDPLVVLKINKKWSFLMRSGSVHACMILPWVHHRLPLTGWPSFLYDSQEKMKLKRKKMTVELRENDVFLRWGGTLLSARTWNVHLNQSLILTLKMEICCDMCIQKKQSKWIWLSFLKCPTFLG